MSKIIYCKKCHNKKRSSSYETAKETIEKNYPGAEIVDMCMSTCGLGKKKFFIQIEEEVKTGQTLEEILKQDK